ncbi:MAG: IS1380 family transposase [Chitinophagaceae bacterium]
MQVQVKSAHYQSFGGINFMEADYKRLGFESLITQHLGLRSVKATYSFSDIIRSLNYMFSIGGDVLDDLNIVRDQMQDHPDIKICSPDTVEYVSELLRMPPLLIKTLTGVTHQVNEHKGFNALLAAINLKGGTLNTTDSYTMDYDGHIVENTKKDASCNYKQSYSYYPVVCSINKLPVHMQNRNGNTPESYGQLPIITTAMATCSKAGVQVKKFRADACCYEQDTIVYLENEKITYYIRAEMNTGLRIALQDEQDWQPAIIGNRKVEVCSIEEKLFNSKKCRRVVAYRYKTKGQLTIDQTDGYYYSAVLTNDTAEALDCIKFYNQRGCEGEHHFKELDEDFGWNKLPFNNMEMNTIYMYLTTIAYLLFNIFKKQYAEKLNFITPQMRIKKFTLHFVTLTAKWIRTARRDVLKIFTHKNYKPLYAT